MGEGFVPLKFSQSTLQFEPLKVVVFDVLYVQVEWDNGHALSRGSNLPLPKC